MKSDKTETFKYTTVYLDRQMSKKIDSLQIMKFFYEDLNREYHIRELAKLTKLNPTTVTLYLEDFRKNNLVTKREERKHVLYRANTENQIFRQEKKHYNIIKILDSGIIDFLEQELNPYAIFLFGSYAKAENTKESDIDLFVLVNLKKDFELSDFNNKLGAEIRLFLYTKEEFKIMKAKNKELLNNILNGIKLQGFLEVF